MLTFPSAPHQVRHPPQGLGELRKSTFFYRGQTQLTDFSQIPKILRARLRCLDVIYIPLVTSSIWDFYFDISEWHILPVRAWTPVLMLHLTNPCAKWKFLSLTKPKGKIYKTKSRGHYITVLKIVTDTKQYMKPFNCVPKLSSGSFKNVINKICLLAIHL